MALLMHFTHFLLQLSMRYVIAHRTVASIADTRCRQNKSSVGGSYRAFLMEMVNFWFV